MRKNGTLVLLAGLLLTGCASNPIKFDTLDRNEARKAATFCNVADYLSPVAGDPRETRAQKADHNAKGQYLGCGWPA